jgi:hypothetical protein
VASHRKIIIIVVDEIDKHPGVRGLSLNFYVHYMMPGPEPPERLAQWLRHRRESLDGAATLALMLLQPEASKQRQAQLQAATRLKSCISKFLLAVLQRTAPRWHRR